MIENEFTSRGRGHSLESTCVEGVERWRSFKKEASNLIFTAGDVFQTWHDVSQHRRVSSSRILFWLYNRIAHFPAKCGKAQTITACVTEISFIGPCLMCTSDNL